MIDDISKAAFEHRLRSLVAPEEILEKAVVGLFVVRAQLLCIERSMPASLRAATEDCLCHVETFLPILFVAHVHHVAHV